MLCAASTQSTTDPWKARIQAITKIGNAMPPRSYYVEPRPSDFKAFARAFFPDELSAASTFIDQYGVPYIKNASHLAAYVGVAPSLIRQILHRPGYHYRCFEIPKANGDMRVILSPKTYLKVIQWWISDNILESAPLLECIHGFRRGRSYITNAAAHLESNHVLNVDVKSFFPSISREMIMKVFMGLGYNADAVSVLADLTTLANAAPTGAPTSPAIGNIVLKDFDEELQSFANARSMTYTRYADDITLSSRGRIEEGVLDYVVELTRKHGFELNAGKTKFMGRGDRMEVTGVVINDGLSIPREWRNFARGFLHRVALNPDRYFDQRHRVFGICGTLKAMDPTSARSVTRLADEVLIAIRSISLNRL